MVGKKNGVVERNWKRPSLLNWCLFDLVGSNPTRITNKVGAYSKTNTVFIISNREQNAPLTKWACGKIIVQRKTVRGGGCS